MEKFKLNNQLAVKNWEIKTNFSNKVYNIIAQTTIRDEDYIIKEWILYQLLIWIEHIFIFDDMSKVPTIKIISELPEEVTEKVTLYRLDDDFYNKDEFNKSNFYDEYLYEKFKNNKQKYILNLFLKYHKQISNWCLFCDVDEFLYINWNNNLNNILDEYKEYDTLSIPWLNYGNSYHIEKPNWLILDNFKYHSSRYHFRWKSISKLSMIDEINSCHIVWPNIYEFNYNEDLFKLPLHFNHYRILNIKTFLERKFRGEIWYKNWWIRNCDDIIHMMFWNNELISNIMSTYSQQIWKILNIQNQNIDWNNIRSNVLNISWVYIHKWSNLKVEELSQLLRKDNVSYVNINELLPQDFDVKYYKKLNPDLEDLTDDEAIEHFYIWWKIENRFYKVDFDLLHKLYSNLSKKLNIYDLENYIISQNDFYKFKRELPNDFNIDLYKEIHPELKWLSSVKCINHFRISENEPIYKLNCNNFDLYKFRLENPNLANLSDIKIKILNAIK